MKKTQTILVALVLLSFAVGILLYPQMPDRVASHWNINSEVDGYMGKFWGLFLMPVISAALVLMFILIPKIDPLKANIAKFRRHYNRFVLLVLVFLFYIYLLTILWNLGMRFDMGIMLVPALAGLFYYCGVLVGNAKRNWFIGIRTPWTLSSDRVWEKTHRLGAKLFKAAAVVMLLAVLLPPYTFWFAIIPVLAITVYLVVYSYIEYRKETRK